MTCNDRLKMVLNLDVLDVLHDYEVHYYECILLNENIKR